MNLNLEKSKLNSQKKLSKVFISSRYTQKNTKKLGCTLNISKSPATARVWNSNKKIDLSKYLLQSAKKRKVEKQNINQNNLNSFSLRNIVLPSTSSLTKTGNNHKLWYQKSNYENQDYEEYKNSCLLKKVRSNLFLQSPREFQIQGIKLQNQKSNLVSDNQKTSIIKIYNHKGKYESSYRINIQKNLYEQLTLKMNINSGKNIIGFESIPKNTVLDYYLTINQKIPPILQKLDLSYRSVYSKVQETVSINSFQIISCIGSGGFSKVYLVKFVQDGKFYAMKVIDKNFIMKNKKKRIVMHQRNIMEELTHPFIVQMKFAFQSINSLIFILQFCPGGQLFGLVKRFRIMDENMAKFYAIEILLGLEHIHQNSIVYRDFKPENILLDIDGHIRIADFGLAKPNIDNIKNKAFSFCGSPQYMPPQMILKKGHSFPVDFYCFGALLYQLVTGLPPFYSKSAQQIYDGTLNRQITFPKHCKVSNQLKSLLIELLCKEQQKRLGCLAGVKQILCHPWFGKINKAEYLQKRISPPISFNSYQDLQQIFKQIKKVNNNEKIQQITFEQKKQKQKKYNQIMEGFKFDYRKKVINSEFQTKQIKKKTNTHKNIKKQMNTCRQTKYLVSNSCLSKQLKLPSSRSHSSLTKFRHKKQQLSARCLDLKNFIR